MQRQQRPVLVGTDGGIERLVREDLRTGRYDECWVQDLVDRAPEVLPIAEIEPAFVPARAVCRELPLPSGYLDNLLATPRGDLVLVECKLWRNEEARRKVVAQAVDYAKDLAGWSYGDLQAAVQRARGEPEADLHALCVRPEDPEGLDETDFVDAVSRNLRRGRCLLLIVGDGITENLEGLVGHLQQHAGMHFVLAAVQLAVYPLGDRQLVVPSVPLRTANVVRGIVTVEDGRAVVSAPPDTPRARRAATLSEEAFHATLDARKPGTADRLAAFLELLEPFGVTAELGGLLNVRMKIGDLRFRLFSVGPDGGVDTRRAGGPTADAEPVRAYLDDLAAAVPGAFVQPAPVQPYVRTAERFLAVWDLLDHREEVATVIRRLHDRLAAGETT